jgi:hypothetical protein
LVEIARLAAPVALARSLGSLGPAHRRESRRA